MSKKIILLHGWGASVSKLVPLKKELEKLGWDVLLPELPGFDAPDPNKPWELENYCSYVLEIGHQKWKEEKYYLFGHSFGARVAIKMASKRDPDLLGLVLCAAGGISRPSRIKRGIFFIISKIGKVLLIFPPLAKSFKKLLYKAAREHDYEKSNSVMKKTMQKVIGEDLKKIIPEIKISTLILWGKMDKVAPYQDALFLRKALSRSDLISFPDQGHKLPYIKYRQVAQNIDKWVQKQ